jgi:hypothetical protein
MFNYVMINHQSQASYDYIKDSMVKKLTRSLQCRVFLSDLLSPSLGDDGGGLLGGDKGRILGGD